MMKIINTIAIGLLALAGITSCEMKDEIKGGKDSSEVGYLELGVSVEAKNNQVTKAAENTGTGTVGNYSPDNFPVIITGVTNTEYTKTFNTYKELQEAGAVELPVGSYKVSAHSEGELKDQMDAPYFSGITDLTINKGATTGATVLCGMQNTKISLSYESTFLASMADWMITISDGKNIITYTGTKNNPGTPKPQYIVVPESTSKLIVTVSGTKIDGEKVSESRNITKPAGGSSEFWGAADDLLIKMDINETVVIPGVSGITITVDVTFAESEDSVEIDVTPDDAGGDTPNPDQPSEKAEPKITSDYLATPITGTIDSDGNITGTPSEALVNIQAEAGFKSLVVKITAGNNGFNSALKPLGLNTGRDLLTLDSNNAMDGILIEVLNPLPKAGDENYSLDIAKFISMMGAYGVTSADGHIFDITVTDAKGKTVTATLKVILNAKQS